jgi:hypothetical protein
MEESIEQLLTVAEMMIKSATRNAEPMRQAVDLNAADTLFYQYAASRLNPHIRRHLLGASRHQTSSPALVLSTLPSHSHNAKLYTLNKYTTVSHVEGRSW